jgi:pimeloyl-ACP methyl ester carboxylesterase
MLPFDEQGEGPALVLLHAGVADRTMWAELLAPLAAAGHAVIAPDLPGFGEAAVAWATPWLDVLATLDELGVERASLVGCSFGGAVALRVALLAPERVDRLVLVSAPPPGLEPSERLRAAWAAEGAAIERGDLDAAARAVAEAWTLPGAPDGLRERIAAMQRRAYENDALIGEVEEAPDALEADPGLLTTIEVPALVLAGEHDMDDFRDGARRMAAALPNARHEEIPGAGHLAALETPEAFLELVLGFV